MKHHPQPIRHRSRPLNCADRSTLPEYRGSKYNPPQVDPKKDQVHVDGDRVFVRPPSEHKWIALHKAKGVICTVSDELGRPCAVDAVPRGRETRLVPVGRLDRDSCGLLLMTNENSWVRVG